MLTEMTLGVLFLARNAILFMIFEKCFVDKGKTIPKVCSFSKFPNHPHRSRRQHCGSQLLRAAVTKDGEHKFYPLKVYCYKPLIESLQTLLSKPGVLNSCEHWRERKIPKILFVISMMVRFGRSSSMSMGQHSLLPLIT